MRISQNLDLFFFFADSLPIFFSLLLLSFFSPFLFSLSSTLYPLSIHWKSFDLSPFKNRKWNIDQLGDLFYFTANFAPKTGHVLLGTALPHFSRYSKWTHVWMDLSLL